MRTRTARFATAGAAAVLLVAAAVVPGTQAQQPGPEAAQHLGGTATSALLLTPPPDPSHSIGPPTPLPANPRQSATRAQANTAGFDGDARTSRASADGPGAASEANPVDPAASVCPASNVIADATTRGGESTPAGPVTIGPGAETRSTVRLVDVGRPGLAVRAEATAGIASVRINEEYELRVVREPRLAATAAGSDGLSRVEYRAPIAEVVHVPTDETVARLGENRASYTSPDESEFDGRNQPFRVTVLSTFESIESPDGSFARGRAALARIRFQPSLEIGEVTVGPMEASATAPPGGVRCDGSAPAARTRPHVLVYEGNSGFEHVSRHEANRTLARIANESDAYSFEITDQSTFLRPDLLAGADMVMFNNNVGNMPTDQGQRDALEAYLLAGGAAGGIHSATDANYEWDEYGEMFGARFDQHPHIGYMPEWGKARLVVEDETSPITSGWHEAERGTDGRRSFQWADEYYRWREQDVPALRSDPDVNVLLSLDTKTVHPGTQQGFNPYGSYRVEFQPVAWTKTFRGAGRVFYTNMGHNGFSWAHPEFRTMMLEGIRWAVSG